MYSLLKGIYEHYTRKPSFNVIIIGLDNAGKTTLLEQVKKILCGTEMTGETVPTIGLNVSKCDFQGVQFQFWDLGGGGDLPKLWEKYYSEAHVVFFVLDSTAETDRMKMVRKSLEVLVRNEEIEGVPVAILANKLDLQQQQQQTEISTQLNNTMRNYDSVLAEIKETFNPLMALIEARESKVFGVSAINGMGVLEALEWMVKVVEINSPNRPPNFV